MLLREQRDLQIASKMISGTSDETIVAIDYNPFFQQNSKNPKRACALSYLTVVYLNQKSTIEESLIHIIVKAAQDNKSTY